jgi:hypothetical protein
MCPLLFVEFGVLCFVWAWCVILCDMLQILRSWFDSRRYHIFLEAVGLERGPLSLVSTIEELVERKVAAPVQKSENTAIGIRHADHVAPSIRKCWH